MISREDEVLVIVRDITASKQAEESLKIQENFLRQVIDANPNLIFVKNREGCYTMANKAVAEKYNTTIEELIGKKIVTLIPKRRKLNTFAKQMIL